MISHVMPAKGLLADTSNLEDVLPHAKVKISLQTAGRSISHILHALNVINNAGRLYCHCNGGDGHSFEE